MFHLYDLLHVLYGFPHSFSFTLQQQIDDLNYFCKIHFNYILPPPWFPKWLLSKRFLH